MKKETYRKLYPDKCPECKEHMFFSQNPYPHYYCANCKKEYEIKNNY